MIKAQEGDLITVQAESVKHQFMESGDFESVLIESGDSGGPLNDLEAWSKKHIYKIIKNDLHKEIAKYGVKIGRYTLEAIKIDSFAFPVEGEVKVNGLHNIPFRAKKRTRLADTYFLEDVTAGAIATALNIAERDKAVELRDAMEKAVVMLDQIVNKKAV